jgi:hypothetical protein
MHRNMYRQTRNGKEKVNNKTLTFLSSCLYQPSLCPTFESDSLARRKSHMPSKEWTVRDSDSVGYSIPSPATKEAISIMTGAADTHWLHPMMIIYWKEHVTSNLKKKTTRDWTATLSQVAMLCWWKCYGLWHCTGLQVDTNVLGEHNAYIFINRKPPSTSSKPWKPEITCRLWSSCIAL